MWVGVTFVRDCTASFISLNEWNTRILLYIYPEPLRMFSNRVDHQILSSLSLRLIHSASNCRNQSYLSSTRSVPRELARNKASITSLPSSMTSQNPTILWDGAATQEELMHKDECILVDDADTIIGHASKYDSHRFTPTQPNGILHRAFSVFLFNSQGKLLLQQRAASKITFPNVWTNTCCSHPLYGYSPSEVDAPDDILQGTVPGIKHAAVRKLMHELGISIPASSLKFLTRLHYCARDTETWGPQAEWGEHEIDYVLFARGTAATGDSTPISTATHDTIDMNPNSEEVSDTRYVTLDELKHMMKPESGLLWSPWFRIIAENFLETWWNDLDGVFDDKNETKYVDTQKIHKIM